MIVCTIEELEKVFKNSINIIESQKNKMDLNNQKNDKSSTPPPPHTTMQNRKDRNLFINFGGKSTSHPKGRTTAPRAKA